MTLDEQLSCAASAMQNAKCQKPETHGIDIIIKKSKVANPEKED